jgi:S1-C subfamily serine protease
MNDRKGPRARVSRETRLLLLTILVSIAALSLLARLRFPEQPARVNPVPPLLTQLAAPRAFDDLAAEVARLEGLVLPAVDVVPLEGREEAGIPLAATVPAFRFRDDRSVAILGDAAIAQGDYFLLGFDPGSGLAVLGRPAVPPAPFVPAWAAGRTVQSRYLTAAVASPQGPALRPVLVGPLTPVDSNIWPGTVWQLDAAAPLQPGTPLFTMGGAFAGLVAAEHGAAILVPTAVVLAEAERLLLAQPRGAGTLGLELQPLPPAFAATTGATGLLVSWVDPDGPAAGLVAVTDVVEGLGSTALTLETWRVHLARLAAGDQVNLRISRDGVVHAVTIVAVEAAPPPPVDPRLGATFRVRPRIGAEIVAVDRGLVADRTGLRPGDLVTRLGNITAPTPAQIAAAFTAAEPGQVLLAAVTRGEGHLVLELVKP